MKCLTSGVMTLPVTSRYASDLVFPLATISANFSCLEFRRTGIALPLFTAWARFALRVSCCEKNPHLRRAVPLRWRGREKPVPNCQS